MKSAEEWANEWHSMPPMMRGTLPVMIRAIQEEAAEKGRDVGYRKGWADALEAAGKHLKKINSKEDDYFGGGPFTPSEAAYHIRALKPGAGK